MMVYVSHNTPEPIMPQSSASADNTVMPAQVLRRFRVVFNAVRTHFQQVEKQVGIGGAQVWALSLIKVQPGIGIGELARQMDIHQSTASNLVKSLLRKELIRVGRATDDRRHVLLHIMPAAQALLDQVPGPFEGVLPVALSQLSEQTLERMDHDLQELIRLLKVDERAASIPLAQL